MKTFLGYWFSREDGTTDYQKIPAAIGRTDRVEGEIVPCRNGLHASPTPSDALKFACGSLLWEVELTEAVEHMIHWRKYAGRTRKYLRCARIPMRHAAQHALGDLWQCPDIVREYLVEESNGKDDEASWAAARVFDGIEQSFNALCMEALDR